jgi:putative endonuclease
MIAPKDSTLLLVHIPLDINAMRVSDPEKALRWRFALRGAMMEAFSAGFHVIGLEVGNEGYVYRFQKSGTWFMYVVQCSDGSLYTGTTTDVVRRFNQHNSGKGAKYTASRRPVTLLGTWMYIDRAAASQAELRFKRLRRTDKERIISNKSPFDGAEFD